jgi:hypothetical protein
LLVRPGKPPITGSRISGSGDVPGLTLSDSGRTAVITEPGNPGRADVVDTDRADVREAGPTTTYGSTLAVTTDDEVLLVGRAEGVWERRRLVDWSLDTAGEIYFKNTNRGVGLAADGGSIIYTDDSPDVMVWRTDAPAADPQMAPSTLRAPIGNPVAVALSPDGSLGAVADTGTV